MSTREKLIKLILAGAIAMFQQVVTTVFDCAVPEAGFAPNNERSEGL